MLVQSSYATAFSSLWKCLRSVRRYASCGLVFTRNKDFNVVNKDELNLENDATGLNPSVYPVMTPSVWRTRTRSGSNSSQGDRSASSSRQASPTTAPRKPKRLPGLQASQEQVQIPPQHQVEELRKSFYAQLAERLANVSSQLNPSPTGGPLSLVFPRLPWSSITVQLMLV